jgi:hypothetical protein
MQDNGAAMKIFIVLGCMLLCSCELVAQTPQTPGESLRPIIVIERPTQNLGSVRKGDRAQAEFVIKNEGGADLSLGEIFVPCGCMLASGVKVIKPKSAGTMQISLDTADLSGSVAKVVYVKTNDPDRPVTKVFLVASVEPRVRILPSTLIHVVSTRGESHDESFTLSSNEPGFAIQINKDSGPTPSNMDKYIAVEVAEVPNDVTKGIARSSNEPGTLDTKSYVVNVKMAAAIPEGEFSKAIRLNTGLPVPSTVDVSLVGVVLSRLSVIPPQVELLRLKAGTKNTVLKNVIVVNNVRNASITIAKAQLLGLPGLSVEARTVDDGEVFNIILSGEALKSGVYDGTLLLEIMGAENTTIQIPIHAQVL